MVGLKVNGASSLPKSVLRFVLDKGLTPIQNFNFFPDFQDVPNKSPTSKLNICILQLLLL